MKSILSKHGVSGGGGCGGATRGGGTDEQPAAVAAAAKGPQGPGLTSTVLRGGGDKGKLSLATASGVTSEHQLQLDGETHSLPPAQVQPCTSICTAVPPPPANCGWCSPSSTIPSPPVTALVQLCEPARSVRSTANGMRCSVRTAMGCRSARRRWNAATEHIGARGEWSRRSVWIAGRIGVECQSDAGREEHQI